MKTSKVLSITTLAIIALLLTAFTWAYWTNDVNGSSNSAANTITLGKGTSATTQVSLTDISTKSGFLVPKGRTADSKLDGAGEIVEEIQLNWNILWNSKNTNTANGTVGTLTASVTNSLGGITDEANLLNVRFEIENGGKIIADNTQPVKVTAFITLREPVDKAEYERVVSQSFVSDFTFTVTPN